MTKWRKRTIMDMAEQAGMLQRHNTGYDVWIPEYLEEFAALVREDERDKWMEHTAILIRGEREACARVCEAEADDGTEGEWDTCCLSLANRIRDRGQA
jgi:hypothetical protein